MITLETYLQNPCATLSIPYWKAKSITIPNSMKILHEKDFSVDWLNDYNDEPYFRLFHSMKGLNEVELPGYEFVTASPEELDIIVSVINRSYGDLQVSVEQIRGYTKTPVYCPELWILVKETATGACVGCGIADFDAEAEELILEWIQVLPEYRGKNIGTAIVSELLRRGRKFADFATVSGKVRNATKPEALYRRCGFTGNDVWHVLHKKRRGRPMTREEIKIRQVTNQYLVKSAPKLRVVQDLCGVQAQFMTNALHSLKIRCTDYNEATVKDGLVKNWTVRGTVHVFAEEDLPLFVHCNNGTDYRRNEWNGYTFWNQRDKWALTPERQQFLSQVILDALKTESCTREELKEICRKNGMTEAEESSMFDQWGGGIRELCERGFMNYVVQEKKAFCLAPEFTPIPEEEANLELARRYFTNFGPATIHDAMYYFHATATQVKKWIADLPVQAVECEGRTYYYIENGKTYDHEMPKCLFLAGFDQLMLGYEKKESLYLKQENLRSVFNLAGIVMPTLMLDGQVVGKWKLKNQKLSIELFEQLGKRDKKAVKDKADALWNDLKKVDIL